jgi:hypothetical protein
MVHRRPGRAQAAQQTIGQHLVVFRNENAHACLLSFATDYDDWPAGREGLFQRAP